MFLKGAFKIASNYIIRNRILPTKLGHNFKSKFIKTSSIFLLVSSTLAQCIGASTEVQPEIHQITKQQLVQLIHKDHSQQFVIIVYDRFKRFNQKQFGEQLKPIIEECKNAKVGKVYLIDSKQKDHLAQIYRILKNKSEQIAAENDQQQKLKKNSFECFFKSRYFNQAIEIEADKGRSLSNQIAQIKCFQVKPNNSELNQILNNRFHNPLLINQTYVVKQCLSQGQCTQSYKRQIKSLIEGGMLNGKTDEFNFQLIVDHPTGILTSSSSEYVKNFIKNTERLKGKSINPNRKEEMYVFRKDLFGSQVSVYSQWLEKQGFNYNSSGDKFLMFIRPRINLISKINTLPDLMWFLRTAKLNSQVSISLNNIERFRRQNNKETLQVLKLLYQHFPKINYLVINSQKIRQLIRHINADYKYVIFKQDSTVIWKKEFLNLDILQSLPSKPSKEQLFSQQFQGKIVSFINHPQIKSFVQLDKQLEINLQKLKNLRDQQLKKVSLKKYIIRVCKQHCHRYMEKQTLDNINGKVQEPINVYWIDSRAQNIGVQDGDYVLKDGELVGAQVFMESS